MFEDSGCAFPCGEEPMGCPTCPDLGRTTKPKSKDVWMDEYLEAYYDPWYPE